MKNKNLCKIVYAVMVFSSLFLPVNFVSAELVGQNLGVVNDLLVSSDSNLYFFERDESIKSQTWLHDTRIMASDSKGIHEFSNQLFIFPTELNEYQDFLIFAVLSDECLGEIRCDYQDIIKMSKTDSSYKKIIEHLKSAVHISIDDDAIYISESNGKVWRFSTDGTSKELLAESSNIIMDMVSNDGNTYWIEEIDDQNNRILSIGNEKSLATIDENLKIPYDLQVTEGYPHWLEIYLKPENGTLAERTMIKKFENDNVEKIVEFENTTPISREGKTYGPYRVFGDYLFLVNNTEPNSSLHLVALGNKTIYDIATDIDHEVKFLRNDNNNLYTVGIGNNGFVIERFSLPVSVPEFSEVFLYGVTIIGLSLIVVLKKIFRH